MAANTTSMMSASESSTSRRCYRSAPVNDVARRRRPGAGLQSGRRWRRAEPDSIALHECRHTFASLLIASGVNAKAIYGLPRSQLDPNDIRPLRAPHAGNEEEAVALVDAYLERAIAGDHLAHLADDVPT